jgi:RsiW-degrading membrane proteinase PrsW (M82 family)
VLQNNQGDSEMKQSTVRTIALLTLVSFGILTAIALWVDGVTGVFASIVSSWGSIQIYVDLLIALSIILVWLYRDAKAQGHNPWPWIVATLVTGSFAPLMYLCWCGIRPKINLQSAKGSIG